MKRWLSFAAIVALQAADLATTWVGIHLPGLHEIDDCNFWVMCAGKIALLAVCWVLLRRPRAAWLVTGIMAAVYIPVVAHNVWLILQAKA